LAESEWKGTPLQTHATPPRYADNRNSGILGRVNVKPARGFLVNGNRRSACQLRQLNHGVGFIS
jgi:hypothetical protein